MGILGLNPFMQVNSTTSATAASADEFDATSVSAQVMSQGDFLKLLVAQMTSQNPIDPMDNQDLLGQMVQFSTLQQNTSLQKALASMQTSQSLVQANALLGRQVTVQVDPTTTAQGVVTGVTMDSNTPGIMVNGTTYALSQVIAISTAANSGSSGSSSSTAKPPVLGTPTALPDIIPVTSISVPSVKP
jgi:flagellar basal-body rod modification protein FlgD